MDDPRPEAQNGAAEPRHPESRTRAPRVRCAAVVPAGLPDPTELSDAMRRRGIEMQCFRDVYSALLSLLCGDEDDSAAVVFVEPGLLANDQARRLARAVERRLPRLTLWSFASENGERARLRPYDGPPPPGRGPEPGPRVEVVRRPSPPSAPRLRLAGFHEDDEHERGGDRHEIQTPSELLTSEEIAMLLDDGPEREESQA